MGFFNLYLFLFSFIFSILHPNSEKTPVFKKHYHFIMGFPGGAVVKKPPAIQEMWVQSLGQEDPLATHSSILAWEIPWTEEPGELQSMALQRAGHNLATI